MKIFIGIWFVFTVSLAVAGGMFAGLYALGVRSPFIGPIVAGVLLVCLQTLTPWVRKHL